MCIACTSRHICDGTSLEITLMEHLWKLLWVSFHYSLFHFLRVCVCVGADSCILNFVSLRRLKKRRGFYSHCVNTWRCCLLSPFLTGRMFVRPNILRTLRRTMIRFLIEHLVRRIWFGQSRLYFILNWLVMRCKLRPELAADAQQTAWSKM